MANLTIKGIPDDLYRRLKKAAARHRRSINSEVLVVLERVLRSGRVDAEERLRRADALRARLALPPLTEERLRAAKRKGRP